MSSYKRLIILVMGAILGNHTDRHLKRLTKVFSKITLKSFLEKGSEDL